MARIGSFGGLVFEASESRILTAPSLSESGGANLQKHTVAGSQPIVEFVAPADRQISLELLFARYLGVDPATEAQRLIEYCDTGARFPLIIGGAARGGARAQWVIESWSNNEEITDAAV